MYTKTSLDMDTLIVLNTQKTTKLIICKDKHGETPCIKCVNQHVPQGPWAWTAPTKCDGSGHKRYGPVDIYRSII